MQTILGYRRPWRIGVVCGTGLVTTLWCNWPKDAALELRHSFSMFIMADNREKRNKRNNREKTGCMMDLPSCCWTSRADVMLLLVAYKLQFVNRCMCRLQLLVIELHFNCGGSQRASKTLNITKQSSYSQLEVFSLTVLSQSPSLWLCVDAKHLCSCGRADLTQPEARRLCCLLSFFPSFLPWHFFFQQEAPLT